MKTNSLIVPLFLLAFINLTLSQQIVNENFVPILPTDTKDEVVNKAANIVPTHQQYEWQKMEYIAFLHFGINTFTNREWGDGNEDPKIFNPEKFDAEQWARALKGAGIKMAILTAKHHDGFCLWPSKYTEHSVKNSSWKNGKGDVVREFTDACRKYGLKVGLYLSPWDRNNPMYGNSPRYNEFYLNQLRELLTNYGEISEVWFDGACGEGPNGKKQIYDWQSYYKLIRELQPNAVIFGMSPDLRWVGTETGYGREAEWSVIPIDLSNVDIKNKYPLDEIYSPHDYVDYDLGNREKLYEAKGLFWYPAEADVSIRPGWFYHKSQDDSVKSIEKLLDIYFSSVGRNCVLLLNIPPDQYGLICQKDIDTLMTLKRIIDDTFKKNFAEESNVVFGENRNEVRYESFFQKKELLTGSEDIVLNFILFSEVSFDVVMLQEDIMCGQRIEKFHLDYWDGKEWIKFTEGATVGYKRLLRFNPVKTNKVRLTIEQSRANPRLANFGLFKLNK